MLVHRFRQGSSQLSDEHLHLLYEQVNNIVWTASESASALANVTYNVVLYDVPPFVRLNDVEGLKGDPGNVNQTRTSRNGGISGIVIDFLDRVEYYADATFRYYYPCRRLDVLRTGKCDAALASMSNESIKMLASGLSDETSDFMGGGKELCGDSMKCFSAGAHKISEAALQNYHVTQPFMMTGYRLVTLAEPIRPGLFDWASPFDYGVWIIIGVEILACSVAIFMVEFRADNESFATKLLLRIWDAIYYSATILLGVADKQPVTHGGRTIVLAQLFFTLILQAVFTGNLNNILLKQPVKTKISSFQDFTNPLAPNFRRENTICYPSTDPVSKNFMDIEAGKHQNVVFNVVTEPDIHSCLKRVYTGNVTAAFYDAPIVEATIGSFFMQTGKCGLGGGFCSNWAIPKEMCGCNISQSGCNMSSGTCPSMQDLKCTLEFTPRDSYLEMVGEIFNPVGYALLFPRTATMTDYLALSQVSQYVKEEGQFDSILKKHLAMPPCSSEVPPSTVVELVNMFGLFFCCGGIIIIGFGVGYLEVILRLVRKCGAACCDKTEEATEAEAEAEAETGTETQARKPKHAISNEFKNKPPPILPLNFTELPVRACLEEIRERLRCLEETLAHANTKASDAIEQFERSLIEPPD